MNKLKEMNRNEIALNYELLHMLIRNSNLTFKEIAKRCGMSRDALYTKVNGEREFKLSEYVRLCRTLEIELKLLL